MKESKGSKKQMGSSSGGSVPLPKSKRGPKAFFKGVSSEAKKVTWPKPKDATRLTLTVIWVSVLITGLLWIIGMATHMILKTIGASPL